MNIANFIEWFITEVIRIGSFMLFKLDQITIAGNVSLMDFIITITIIGIFLGIVLTLPQNINRVSRREEIKARKEKKK